MRLRAALLALALVPCVGLAHARLAYAPNPGPPMKPAPNPLKNLTKKTWVDRNKGTGATSSSDPKAAVERLGNFELGQRIRCDLPTKGSRGIARFKAIKGTKLNFSAATTGKIGSSSISLTREDGSLVKAFKQDGRRFEIADVEVPESGTYHVKFLHDGEDGVQFVMGTRAEIPDKLEMTVGIATDGARNIAIDGGEGRTILGIAIVPVTPGETIDARLTITDDHHGKVASLEGFGLKPLGADLKIVRPIAIDEYVAYSCDLWLVRGTSPQSVIVTVRFDNPPAVSGTVDLRAP